MSAFSKAAYFWRSALAGFRHAPLVHFIAVLTIGIALFAVGLARGGAGVLESMLSSLGGEVQVTVYLEPSLTEAQLMALQQEVEKRSSGHAVQVAPDAALARLKQELGDLGPVLEQLHENPLPPSLELQLPEALRAPSRLKTLATQLRALPGVTGVDYGAEAVERLSSLARALRVGGMIGFAWVAVATLIIVAATLQLALYARREEIEIQKLVGATESFVKAPFLIEGLFQGLLGAGLAILGLWGFGLLALPPLHSAFAFLLGPTLPAWLSLRQVGELLGVGCFLGWGGSFIAVGRFSRR